MMSDEDEAALASGKPCCRSCSMGRTARRRPSGAGTGTCPRAVPNSPAVSTRRESQELVARRGPRR